MALAVATHHSAQRGEWRDLNEAPWGHRTASAETTNVTSKERVAGDAVDFELFDEDTAGLRPGASLGPSAAGAGTAAHVEHEDVICLIVQILNAPVLQLGEELVHFFRSLDTQLPVEQVIDVPKISDDSIQPRIVDYDLRYPQNVEQLVEVPTLLSFASLQQQTAEHIVDIPVPHGRGGLGGGGLHGFLPEQNSTVFMAEQPVDDPVCSGGILGFLLVQGSTAFGGAEHLAPGGSVHGSRPDQGSTAFGRAEHLVLGGSFHGTAFFGAQHVRHQDFSQDRVQQRFAEVEDLLVVLKTLSRDKVQQRFVEQMMLKTSSGAPKSYCSTPAVSTRFPQRRKRST